MAIPHVFVTGRDRRHLSELRNKFRVVVVGAPATRRGIVVDAYIPSKRVDWLRNKGYGVERFSRIDRYGLETSYNHCDYGVLIVCIERLSEWASG